MADFSVVDLCHSMSYSIDSKALLGSFRSVTKNNCVWNWVALPVPFRNRIYSFAVNRKIGFCSCTCPILLMSTIPCVIQSITQPYWTSFVLCPPPPKKKNCVWNRLALRVPSQWVINRIYRSSVSVVVHGRVCFCRYLRFHVLWNLFPSFSMTLFATPTASPHFDVFPQIQQQQ